MANRRSSRPFWLGEDKRQFDHVRLHIQLIKDKRVGAKDMAVYAGIAVHAEVPTGNARPSVATLAAYTGLSERTVFRVLAHLKDLGYIEVQKRHGMASKYSLLPPPPLPTPDTLAGVTDDTPDMNSTTPLTGVPFTPDTGSDELEPKDENQELPRTLRTKKPKAKTFVGTDGLTYVMDSQGQWQPQENTA